MEVGAGELTALRQHRRQDRRPRLGRPVPRPAPAVDPADPGAFKLMRSRGGVLAGQREEPAAAADLRHRVADPRRAEGVPEAARGGRPPRPPQAGRRPRPVLLPRGDRLRSRGLPPQGRDHPPGDGELLADPARAGRLLVREHPAHHQGQPVRDLRPPRLVRGRHVPADGDGGRELLPQADELPVPRPDLPVPRAVLPRAAAADVRVRHRLPVREVRRGARPHPGARHDPGRRAHLLHRGADGGRAEVAAAASCSTC